MTDAVQSHHEQNPHEARHQAPADGPQQGSADQLHADTCADPISTRAEAQPLECRVFGCNMPALDDGRCVRCGEGPGRGPDMCPGECGRKKRRGLLMCQPCWLRVSPDTQAEVLTSWTAWRRQNGNYVLLRAYKTAARQAVREVTGA